MDEQYETYFTDDFKSDGSIFDSGGFLSSEDQFMYDQAANNWAGYDSDSTINTKEDLGWNTITDLFSSGSNAGDYMAGTSGASSSDNSGSLNFGSIADSATAIIKGMSGLGTSVVAGAAVLGKTVGQLQSAGNVYDASKNSVLNGTNLTAVLVKYLPYMLLAGGAILAIKALKE